MTHFIIDASVAAKWFLKEDYTAEAKKVLEVGENFSAPDFMQLEMDNLLCKRFRRGDLSKKDADDARVLLKEIPITYHPSLELRDRAYQLALITRQSVSDCLYLALAIRLKGKLVTADQRFYKNQSRGPLSDYLEWVGNI